MKPTKLYYFASYLLFALGSSWLLAPFVNSLLFHGAHYISEYEAPGMPYSWLFRLCDGLVVLLTSAIAFKRRVQITNRFHRYVVPAVFILCVLLLIDAAIPVRCVLKQGECYVAFSNIANFTHIAESYLASAMIMILSLYIARKTVKQIWLPILLILCGLSGLVLHHLNSSYLFGVQATATLLTMYLIWYITLADLFICRNTSSRYTSLFLSVMVGLGALISVIDSSLHIHHLRRARELPFSEISYLSAHRTIIFSLVLLYVLRAFYRKSRHAWHIVITLIGLDIAAQIIFVRYSYLRLILYLFIFVTLLLFQGDFFIKHDLARFKQRIIRAFTTILATALVATVFSVTFHYRSNKAWSYSVTTPAHVLKRVLLIEVGTNNSMSRSTRLFNQSLTLMGSVMYSWVVLGFFLPYLLRGNESAQKSKLVEEYLEKYSASSEDFFKLWPEDKQVFMSAKTNGIVLYKQKGRFAYALANPLCAKGSLKNLTVEFQEYCRQHGVIVCWIMIDNNDAHNYRDTSLLMLPMGSSAVVSVTNFANNTLKNKWWRWKINKATKSGYQYASLKPPHSQATLNKLADISDKWLAADNNTERGFALGYFDKKTLSKQIIHTVLDDQNNLVAFANQLSTYNDVATTTIDLMRYLPEHKDVMAFLLSRIILDVSNSSSYTHFDLGFVPLAHISEGELSEVVVNAVQKAIAPVFSAHGLTQFKNKFEPTWTRNYIAVDGDLITLSGAISKLPGALKLP